MQSIRSSLIDGIQATRRAFVRDLLAASAVELGASELTLSQFAGLVILSDGRARTINELAGLIARSVSAASRLLDKMVQRRLIVRASDPQDRRVRRVTIAPRGAALVNGLLSRRAEAQLRLIARLSPGERRIAEKGLRLLAEAARRAEG